jgi:predicted PurR-regulated permease PerM
MARARKNKVARIIACSIAGVLVVFGVIIGRPVARGIVIIAMLSTLLAYLIAPAVERLRKVVRVGRPSRPVSRGAAILLIYLLVGGGGIAAWRTLQPRAELQLTELGESLPHRLELLKIRLRGLEERINRLADTEPVRGYLAATTRAASSSLEAHALSVADEVVNSRPLVPWLTVVPLLAWLLVTRWDSFRRTTVSALPEGHLRWRGDEFFAHLNYVLAGYTRAQVFSCAIVGLACTLGFLLVGVPYALAVGLLAGVLEFFPVVGPLAAAVIAASLVDGDRLLVLVAFLIGLRMLQDYVIYPRLIGRGMHLHALGVIAAIWVGAAVGGAAGVLVAVPAAGIAFVAVRHVRDYRAIERLVREHEPVKRDPETLNAASGSEGPATSPAEEDPEPPAADEPTRVV